MGGPQAGFLATYNSLTDKHLVGYFSNTRIRRHLQRSGLISRSGRIIPEKEYRQNAMRRDRQRCIQECLARAISLKVLDLEHHHQLETKRKLESSVRKERLPKIKVEQSRRLVEDASPVLFPHPPLGPRTHYGLRPSVAAGPAGPSRPRALAPGLDHHDGHASHLHRWREPAFPETGDKSGLRLVTSIEYVTDRSLDQLPVISNDVVPVPPPPLQKDGKSVNAVRNGMPRARRFRPTTAPNDAEQLLTKNSGGFSKPSLRSNAFVTMIFLGKSLHLSHGDADYRDEIKVCQQHCGGENLCVYKGKLLEGETFQFISRRHHGFPFSLTFFLNGMPVDRLSCCCEYKHQKRSRLGGRHGYFGFLNVEGASPCYRCIIAMGLDRKSSPPERKMEEDHEEELLGSWGDGVSSEPSKSRVEQKSSKNSVLVILPGHEASVENTADETETRQEYRKEERKKLSEHESEGSQEDTSKYEYDEDFEADEEVNEEGQAGDEMNGMSKSSSDDEKHDSDYEKESKMSSQKALQASDSEKDESGGYSDSDSEDDKQAPDGAFLAGGTRTLDVQKAAEQVDREGQMVGERQVLEKEDSVTEGGDARSKEAGEELARAGALLPEEDGAAVLWAEGQPVVEDSAPGQGIVAEKDPKGKRTGEGMESGAEVSPGEQDVLMEGTRREAALGEQAPGAEELAGALLGREAGRAVPEGQEVAGEVSKGEEAVEDISEAKGDAGPAGEAGPPAKEVGEMVPEAEEAVEEGGFTGKGVVAGAVAEREEAVGDASLSEEGNSRLGISEREESVEEAVSEGEEAVEGPGTPLETGDMNVCTEAAIPRGEDVKPNEFSQLKVSGQEWVEMGKTATGAATSETGEASEVDESSLLSAEDAVEGSEELGEGPVLQGAPQLESLVGAGGDPISEGSSQLEETTTAEEEEDSAEVLSSGNSGLDSKEKTESAREEEPSGGVMGVCAEIARAESGGGEGLTGGAAGPSELAAGMEGSREHAEESGNKRPPGEVWVAGASLPTPGPCPGEAGVVAVAVVGAQAGWGAQVGTPVLVGQEMAAEGRVGDCRAAQEGRTGAVGGTQGGMEAVAAEGVSAKGRGAAEESVRDGEGVAGSPGHGEPCGVMSLREQPIAALGDGGAEPGRSGSTGSEGLFLDTQPAWAALGAAVGESGLGEKTEQVEVKAEGEQPGLGEDARETEAAPVLESAQNPSGIRGAGKDSPGGSSPDTLGAVDEGERSCGAVEDVVNPDAAVVPSVQPQDGGATRL